MLDRATVALFQPAGNRLSHLLVSGTGETDPDHYRKQILKAQEEEDRAEMDLVALSADFQP